MLGGVQTEIVGSVCVVVRCSVVDVMMKYGVVGQYLLCWWVQAAERVVVEERSLYSRSLFVTS